VLIIDASAAPSTVHLFNQCRQVNYTIWFQQYAMNLIKKLYKFCLSEKLLEQEVCNRHPFAVCRVNENSSTEQCYTSGFYPQIDKAIGD